MKLTLRFLLIASAFFLSACSVKEYELTQTKIIIIKSPKIKFGDIGYIRSTDKAVELELFIAGSPVEKFTINHLICVSEGCMSKSGFNADYLHSSYPDELLQHILLGHPIYESQGMQKKDDGFEQIVKNQFVDIKYRVNEKETFFKDRRNRIIFKIKEIS